MTFTRVPVAYLRRSKVEAASPGDISRDTQLASVRARAGDDAGHLVVIEDWGRSGRGSKLRLREGYARLIDMVREDRVSSIYAYNWSRLGRSTRDLLDLVELCRAHQTAIVTATGAQVDPSTADGRMMVGILSSVDEWQAEVQAERTSGSLAAWRASHPGESLGRKEYGSDPERPEEDPAKVIDAFERAGSFLGAAKLLTSQGVPTRLGKPWDTKTVSRIVRRIRPGLTGVTRQGQAARAPRMFSGLLVCKCGDTLTSMPRKGSVGYYCRRAHLDPSHTRPYVVSERKVLLWARAQLDSWRTLQRIADLPDATHVTAKLAELESKRERVLDMYADGTIAKVERDRRLGVITGDRHKVEAGLTAKDHTFASRVLVDWSSAPDDVNRAIRTLWQSISMNGGMMPHRAVWHPTEEWDEDGPR